jgi:hypothetical protein
LAGRSRSTAVALETVATSHERPMFVSPRFRDFYGSGPIGIRRRERPAVSERPGPAARELDELWANAEEILLEFAEAHLRAVMAKAEFIPAPVCEPEFIPAPVCEAEFIPAEASPGDR